METKCCTRCNQTLSVSSFGNNAASKDKLAYYCRACMAKATALYRETNREKYLSSKKEATTKQQKHWLQSGMCKRCGSLRLPNHASFCAKHCVYEVLRTNSGINNVKTAEILLDRLYSNPYCPYTGEKLELGVNAHLDHILSRTKHPELISEPSNLEWISRQANISKNGMDKEEFIQFCKIVAQKHS